jgi:uncharacterized protein (TIGR02145 family)
MKKVILSSYFMICLFESYAQNFDFIVDERDEQEYKIVQIGDQWWMAENLNFRMGHGSWYYDNDSIKYHALGRFYIYETATQACPVGWHLPSDEEWKTLEMHIGLSREEADAYNLRGNHEGGKLKSTDEAYWAPPNLDATNTSGFSALGSGIRTSSGRFIKIGEGTSFWTSSEGEDDMAWFRSLHNDRGDIHRGCYKKSFGYNVRCVKD